MEHDDSKEAPSLSESKGDTEGSYDEYEPEYESSDCSITSGRGDNHLHKAIVPFTDIRGIDAAVLQADESVNTTWTDDKHSSYLESIEATFVCKMYGKEYCSPDVCGHSPQSSMTWELECVESHPYCLNMRKPYKQPLGILPLRNSVRPWLSTSSVLASPWIQHFKAKQASSAKKSDAQEHASRTQAPSASTENSHNLVSTTCDTTSNTALLKSSVLVSKKHAAFFVSSDYTQFGDHTKSSNGSIACGFKKLKCQPPLSQMDMVMEEQYNTEQLNQGNAHLDQQNEGKFSSTSTVEELKTPQTGIFEADELRRAMQVSQPRSLYALEKQTKGMCLQMGLKTSTLSQEFLIEKSDQVVPLFNDCCKEAGEQSIVQDRKAMPSKEIDDLCRPSGYDDVYVADEVGLSLPSYEEEKNPTQMGSKTWAWGTQGVRYRLDRRSMSPLNFKH